MCSQNIPLSILERVRVRQKMEFSKTYSPKEIETKWYDYWMKMGLFKSSPDKNKKPYTIVIPPPNVTGILHMGHGLNNTIQDVLIRRAKMQGFNTCWVPGTDHASIATEAKVVAMLKEKGIDKNKLSREEFLKYAWEWKEKYGEIILQQLKKLGAACDWDRTAFTMDDDYYKAVINVFIDLHKKGLIYRGVRMVNWDPRAKTALSDEEVIYKEVNSKLYYIRYDILPPSPSGRAGEGLVIATTRPETILGDTAVCVHPNDERYKNLKGKKTIIPLINRVVPIIQDEYVTMEFGTGALKVTPAHDLNDYHLGIKHKLETIDIFNDDGTLNEKAKLYLGEDRFKVREKIVKELEAKGHLVKVEDIKNNVGFSERTDAVIEPKLSQQWFMKMSELAKPALEVVMKDEVKFHPAKFKNMYRHWMENIQDWCISRQLWWGHRIPAWYLPNGEFVVAENLELAFEKFKVQNLKFKIEEIKQDEDVLDTWFSSWLWPIEIFKGFTKPNNEEIKYYYPTTTLVTAPEIIFFWVARMIMAGLEYQKNIPFKNVYFTGIVRDKQGRKMSKSLGNSPDLLELIDKYGADGVRFGILVCSPAGNDLLFDEKLCEQGRNFCNKLWNALRLIKGWEISDTTASSGGIAQEWFENKFNSSLLEIEKSFETFNISEALMTTYKLIWDDFCSWYLEMVKPEFGKPIDKKTYDATISFFEKLLKLLHPFMPFVTEEIYYQLKERAKKNCIIIGEWPELKNYDEKNVKAFEGIKVHISTIRNIRKSYNIPSKEKIELHAKSNPNPEYKDIVEKFDAIVIKMCNLSKLIHRSPGIQNAISFTSLLTEFFIPLPKNIDANLELEKEKLKKELEYNKGFLKSISAKMSNEKFVANAKPDVIEKERQKIADAEAKIKILEESLAKL